MNRESRRKDPARVLIVDDHPIVREGLAALLEQTTDLEPVPMAGSGREALDRLDSDAPDAAIVDLSLEDMHGLRLVEQMHARKPDLPILVLSIHDESLYAERALRAGAMGYVMKQEASEKVLEALRSILAGEVHLSESLSARLLKSFSGKGVRRDASGIESLTNRELEVVELLGAGKETRDIAKSLHIAVKTVESHLANIREKLGLKSGRELVMYALRLRDGGSDPLETQASRS